MNEQAPNSFRNQPDEEGRFGIHGGRFVAETLMPLILKVEHAWKESLTTPNFRLNSNIITSIISAALRRFILPSG